MAETMTYDPGTDTVTTENTLTESEQESLAIGEEMENQQEQALAGKYKNAEELEKAYIELEKKLGEKSGADSQEESSDEPEAEQKTETDQKPPDSSEYAYLDDLWDQAAGEKGEVSKELIDKISNMSAQEIAQQYLNWRADAATKYIPKPDMSQQDVDQLKNVVGGEANYKNMLQWAQSNLSEREIQMFDSVMQQGDVNSAFFAINSLANKYQDTVGYEGKMLTGAAPKGGKDTYRSQQELVDAMGDKRYDNDPAYRQDVMDKLARSDLKF